jgi:hypothetical protein
MSERPPIEHCCRHAAADEAHSESHALMHAYASNARAAPMRDIKIDRAVLLAMMNVCADGIGIE